MRQILVHPAGIAAVALGLSLGSPAMAFTQDQADSGKQVYDSQCAQCHGVHLEGTEAPGLVGADVMSNWSTPKGLYDFISVAMPPTAPGQLGDETYVNIIAYIMSYNGAQPDDQPLALGEQMASISLPAVTAAGAGANAGAAQQTAQADAEPVPQAYTWGKQLPGGPEPAQMAADTPARTGASDVPQAYTWGKQLPTAN